MKKSAITASGLFLVLFLYLIFLSGCDKVTLPRLTHKEQPVGHSPVAVNIFLEKPLRSAIIERQICDQPWQGHLGHAVAKEFLDVGREAFGEVHLIEGNNVREASSNQPSHITVQLRLIENSLGRGSQVGSENNTYAATLDIQLLALYLDANGNTVGQTPLSYRKDLNIWTPVLDSTGTCNTFQLESELETAARTLAQQMVGVVAKATAPPPGTAGGPTLAGSQPQRSDTSPSPLSIQATLIDGNDNVILEAGEKVGVRVDVTNGGPSPVSDAQVSLSGTSAIIDAFASSLAAPVELGPIQPGSTKSTLLWGKMPDNVTAQRGELVVTVISGSTSSQQTLVSAIRPASDSTPASLSRPTAIIQPKPTSPNLRSSINRYGILIGVDRYQPEWPGIAPRPLTGVIQAAERIKQSAGIPGKQILVLRGHQATKSNMERAITQWLPSRINEQSIVFLYLSGNAITNPKTGEIFLIPFTESPSSSESTFFSLHALQGTLKRSQAKLVLLAIDSPIISLPDNRASLVSPQAEPDWQGLLDSPQSQSSSPVIQVVRTQFSNSPQSHPLAGLNGSADQNKDGRITLGELLDSIGSSSVVYPLLSSNAPERNISLTGK